MDRNETGIEFGCFLKSLEVPVVIFDSNLKVLHFTTSAMEIMNLGPCDQGASLDNLAPDFDHRDLRKNVKDVMLSGLSKEIEIQNERGHWYSLKIKPYRNPEDITVGVILVFVDIDSLKRALFRADAARAEGERGNFVKDTFLATLSHELRTPLAVIFSWAQILRMGVADPERVKRGLETIEESSKIQERLIGDLLDISRVQTGKLQLDIQEVNPKWILQAALDAVRFQAETKQIQFKIHVDSTLTSIHADPTRLQQIFSNLFANAIKFSPKNSEVFIYLNLVEVGADEFLEVKVVDPGKGIAPEFLPHVFEVFSQADSSTTRAFAGLGLGLSIVRKMTELHGGTARVFSEGEGKGATFIVHLPVYLGNRARSSFSAEAIHRSENRELSRLDGVRVLLVEDEMLARDVVAMMLKSYGAHVEATASADEALSVLNNYEPEVLVSDIGMAEKDGYTLIREIRRGDSKANKNLPAIALTAYTSLADARQAIAAGFQIHLAKPVEGLRLSEAILQVLRPGKTKGEVGANFLN